MVTGLVGGKHSMSFMSGWQPQEATWGNNTPNSTQEISCLPQPAMVHGGEKRTHNLEWKRDFLLQPESQSHWQLTGETHRFPLQDSDYWRLQAPSAMPRISKQRMWCKLALVISAGKGQIKHIHSAFMMHTGCSSKNWRENYACFWDGCRVNQIQREAWSV